MIAVLLLCSLGLFHRTAQKAFHAVFFTPAAGLRAFAGRMQESSESLRESALQSKAEAHGTVLGAAFATVFFAVLAGTEFDLAATAFGPMLGLEELPSWVSAASGPAVIAATLVIGTFSPWLCLEIFKPTYLAVNRLSSVAKVCYTAFAMVAFACALAIAWEAATYRATVTSAASNAPAPANVDAVTSLLDAPQSAAPGPTDLAMAAQTSMTRTLYRGVGIGNALLSAPALECGPLSLSCFLSVWVLLVCSLCARILASVARTFHGVLGWLYGMGQPGLEMIQKVIITMARPLISATRRVHASEIASPKPRVWLVALTVWALDLETPGPVGEQTFQPEQDVANAASPPSSPGQQEEGHGDTAPHEPTGEAEPAAHAYEAYPGRRTNTV